jgi:flagellar biosynthesis protein FliQ
LVSKVRRYARVVLLQVPSLLWDLGMGLLVSLFYCMTLIYFSYLDISYKVVLVYMGDLFMCSSLVHHLEAPVLDEQGLSIQLTSDLYMFSVFVHKLEESTNPFVCLSQFDLVRSHIRDV